MRLIVFLTGCCLLVACGDRGAEGASPAAQGLVRRGEPGSTESLRAKVFGPDGQLRESDRVIAGLRLPRGLETVSDTERRHVFRTKVPLDKVQHYFGTRLVTGQVDRIGEGAVYRDAVAKAARGGAVRMDVSLLPAAGGVRIEIVELPPPPAHPPTEAEIRRHMREARMD